MALNPDRIAGLLLAGVFGIRVFDKRRPVWARAAYGAVAADSLREIWVPAGPEANVPVLGYAREQGHVRAPPSEGTNAPPGQLRFNEKRVRTIDERVALVHTQMVHGTRDPKVYQLARAVLAQKNAMGDWAVGEKDHANEARALFNEVRRRVRYTWDPLDYDAFQTPRKTLELRTADCDDYASLLGAMLRAVGLKVRTRIVQTKGSDTWNHIYLAVAIPGKGPNGTDGWMPLDPSVKYPAGWEVPDSMVIRKKDYLVVEK